MASEQKHEMNKNRRDLKIELQVSPPPTSPLHGADKKKRADLAWFSVTTTIQILLPF